MARPKKTDSKLTGRDRTADVDSFKLEPLAELPDYETSDAAELYFYESVGSALIESKQLRIVDIPSLRIAAFWYSACMQAMDAMRNPDGLIQESQNKFKQASPYISVLEKASKMLQMFADRYGLNLTAATKIPKAKSDMNSLQDMVK